MEEISIKNNEPNINKIAFNTGTYLTFLMIYTLTKTPHQ